MAEIVDPTICVNCGHPDLEHEGCVGACTMDETDVGGDVCDCQEFEEPEPPA